MLDDVGFDSFGCFGAEIGTPATDSLAREDLPFTNFHAPPLYSPTQGYLLKGRNHYSVGMSFLSNPGNGLPGKLGSVTKGAVSVAEVFRDGAHDTGAFGKWHLAPIDQTNSAGTYSQWPLVL